jgi:hypothetical protein
MRQRIATITHPDSTGEAYTTAWRLGDRVFHTFTYAGVTTGEVQCFTLHHHEQPYPLETIAANVWHGTVKVS